MCSRVRFGDLREVNVRDLLPAREGAAEQGHSRLT